MEYHPELAGTYVIANFGNNNVRLQAGIPASRRDLPALEVNIGNFSIWVIHQAPSGQGYLYVFPFSEHPSEANDRLSIVKGDEQDQVAEADAGTGSGPGGVSENHFVSPAYTDSDVVACPERS